MKMAAKDVFPSSVAYFKSVLATPRVGVGTHHHEFVGIHWILPCPRMWAWLFPGSLMAGITIYGSYMILCNSEANEAQDVLAHVEST